MNSGPRIFSLTFILSALIPKIFNHSDKIKNFKNIFFDKNKYLAGSKMISVTLNAKR